MTQLDTLSFVERSSRRERRAFFMAGTVLIAAGICFAQGQFDDWREREYQQQLQEARDATNIGCVITAVDPEVDREQSDLNKLLDGLQGAGNMMQIIQGAKVAPDDLGAAEAPKDFVVGVTIAMTPPQVSDARVLASIDHASIPVRAGERDLSVRISPYATNAQTPIMLETSAFFNNHNEQISQEIYCGSVAIDGETARLADLPDGFEAHGAHEKRAPGFLAGFDTIETW